MKSLKRLALSFTLIAVVFTVALAGETLTPPCVPGQTETMPPCASASVNNSIAPGETQTPPADTVDLAGIAEVAWWSLTLF